MCKLKSYCQDLTEGKFTFPTIHAVSTSGHPEGKKVAAILKQKTNDEDLKRYCVSLLEKIGSFAYTRKKLEELEKEVRDEIRSLGGNPLLEALLAEHASIAVEQ